MQTTLLLVEFGLNGIQLFLLFLGVEHGAFGAGELVLELSAELFLYVDHPEGPQSLHALARSDHFAHMPAMIFISFCISIEGLLVLKVELRVLFDHKDVQAGDRLGLLDD